MSLWKSELSNHHIVHCGGNDESRASWSALINRRGKMDEPDLDSCQLGLLLILFWKQSLPYTSCEVFKYRPLYLAAFVITGRPDQFWKTERQNGPDAEGQEDGKHYNHANNFNVKKDLMCCGQHTPLFSERCLTYMFTGDSDACVTCWWAGFHGEMPVWTPCFMTSQYVPRSHPWKRKSSSQDVFLTYFRLVGWNPTSSCWLSQEDLIWLVT